MAIRGAIPTNNAAGDQPITKRRIYDLSDKVVFRQRAKMPFIYFLTQHTLDKRAVTDTKPTMLEQAEEKRKGTLTGCDGTGTAAAITTSLKTFIIANANEFLQAGDMLYVPYQQTTGGSNPQTNSTFPLHGEMLRVESVSAAALSGTSNYIVTCARNNGTGDTSTNFTADSGSSLRFFKQGMAMAQDSRSPVALSKPMEYEENAIQIFQKTWNVTDTRRAVNMYGPDPMQNEAMLKQKAFAQEVEYAFLYNHLRTKKDFEGDQPRDTMGGFFWFLNGNQNADSETVAWSSGADLINGNATSRIWRVTDWNQWTVANIRKFAYYAFMYGSENKVCICGGLFHNILQELFDNKARFNAEKSKQWNMNVTTIDAGHGEMNFVIDYSMEDGHAYDCFVMDLSYLKYCYLKGYDIHIDKGKDGKGLQHNDAKSLKYGLTAYLTLGFSFVRAHSAIVGINEIAES